MHYLTARCAPQGFVRGTKKKIYRTFQVLKATDKKQLLGRKDSLQELKLKTKI